MESDHDMNADHFEDDLSYMYDLDGDYSQSITTGRYTTRNRQSIFADEEKNNSEMKALLMQVINDNKNAQEKKNEAQKKRNTEYENKIKRLEESISKLTTGSKLSYGPMDVFDFDIVSEENHNRKLEKKFRTT